MFMIYGLVAGLVIGLVLGGRLRGLAVSFHWPWLAMAGLLAQVLLFSPAVTAAIGSLGPPLYVASTLLVLVVVVRNIRVAPGLALVVAGGLANLAAIVANGGYMPVVPEAAAAAGRAASVGYSNSLPLARPVLAPLVDRFAIPSGLPFANVFSVGDVLIGLGIVTVIVVAMLRGDRVAPAASEGMRA